jgi:xylulokinase
VSDLSYDQLTSLASAVPPGSNGLVFLPYLTGERTPHLDPQASGAFIGLTARHSLAHLVRAVMEGVVFSMRDGLEIMRGLGLLIDQIRITGGGGRSPLWRQLQTDIYGSETVTLAAEEGPAFGSALLAGVGASVYTNVEEAVSRCVSTTGKTEPIQENVRRYTGIYSIYRDLYGVLQPSMHQLANF